MKYLCMILMSITTLQIQGCKKDSKMLTLQLLRQPGS